ncbi:MAG: hypothetical protein IPG50_26785 [Myxococcales bacterium]|nr:hypothetical protein [Myxococcales bacterium]
MSAVTLPGPATSTVAPDVALDTVPITASTRRRAVRALVLALLAAVAAVGLFDVADGVSIIELKVDDVWQAPLLAERLGRATKLKASNWLDRNTRLQEGLRAQASTSNMIKAFSLLTIAIGVASALFLSVSRRRADIGILRSFRHWSQRHPSYLRLAGPLHRNHRRARRRGPWASALQKRFFAAP